MNHVLKCICGRNPLLRTEFIPYIPIPIWRPRFPKKTSANDQLSLCKQDMNPRWFYYTPYEIPTYPFINPPTHPHPPTYPSFFTDGFCMMTSSNGNIFRVTGHLCGEFTGHKGQWRGALMFSLICVWINGWVNNREAGDFRRYHAHCDVQLTNAQCHMVPISTLWYRASWTIQLQCTFETIQEGITVSYHSTHHHGHTNVWYVCL